MTALVDESIRARPSPGSPSRAGTLLAGGVIVLAALAAYRHSFHVPFVYDDEGSITNNPTLRSLWPIWPVLKPLPGGMPVSGRPILNLSFALNYAVSGLKVWSYHVVNLAIHILAGLTLFAIVRRFIAQKSENRKGGKSGKRESGKAGNRLAGTGDSIEAEPTLFALAVALIWTLHPLQTEAVVYVSQRAESLMGLFYLLTLYFFIRGADSRKFLLLSVFFCLLGMATKEVMVSAPLIVLLYDRTFVAGTFGNAWRLRRKYYLGLASTWLVLIGLVLNTGSRGRTAGFGLAITPWSYALVQFQAIVHYLRLAVWPHPLVFYYGRPVATGGIVGVDAGMVILLLGATFHGLFRPTGRKVGGDGGRAVAFASACFFAILAPSSSIMPVGTELVAEHRMYLSLAAVIAVGVAGIWFLIGRGEAKRSVPACIFIFFAAAVGLGFMTDRRVEDYRSDLALWTDTAEKMPGNSTARSNLGLALLQRGDAPAAIAQCREAIRLNPENARAHSGLADALAQMGGRAEAIEHYQDALRINPRLFEARNNLGIALAQSGRLPEAIEQFQASVRINPDLFETHDNLARLLARTGHLPEAAAEWEAALRLKPDDAGARAHLDRVRALQQNR